MKSRPRRAAPFAAVAALLAALPLALALGANGAQPHTGALVIRAGAKDPAARFVRGNGLYDAKGRRAPLAEPVSGALMGPLAPVAVPEPGASAIAYSSWEPLRQVDPRLSFSKQGIAAGDALGIPSLRVRDADAHDALIERGAYSAAWRADGALAYFKAADAQFRAGSPYVGDVVVRPGVDGRPVRWSAEQGRYVVYGWAGHRLVFYRVGEGESLELLVADAPGRVRPLAEGSAVALSPDGTRIAVASPDSTNVRILDVASGREQAWLDVTTASPSLRWVGYSGSWSGDEIVAPASAGLAVFQAGPSSLELEQVLSVDRAQFPAGVQEPTFLNGSAREVVATADVPPKDGLGGETYFLDCDRVARTCERSDAAPATEWPRLVRDPSRPGGAR